LGELAGHLLLLASIAALGGSAVALASLAAPSGLERVLAAAPVAAALAVCQALLLGLVSLGTEPLALAAASGLTWLACRRLAVPERRVLGEVLTWWAQASTAMRMAAGAGLGAITAWAAWNLYRPDVGIDGVYYHLPEIVAWVHNGRPGSNVPIHPWLDVGSYPVTHEVLLAWAMGISRSLVPMGLLTVAMLPLLGLGGWVALRSLGAAGPVRWLAIAAMVTVPTLASQVDGPANEVPSMAWLLCAAGLGAAARNRPALLWPMIIAAGLAVGSKTTAVPLTAALVAFALWRDRERLRPLTWPLAAAALVGGVVGASWYLRTLIEHGSPFWPFAAGPWGDPVPPILDSYRSLLSSPRATLEGTVGLYAVAMSGGWLTLGAAVLAPLWAPRREVVAGSALVVASVLLWSSAPTTGVSELPQFSASVSQTRYLLPVVALAAFTLALSAQGQGLRANVGVVALAASVAWSLGQIVTGEFPDAFSSAWLIGGAVAGGVLASLRRLRATSWSPPSGAVRAGLAGAAVVAGAAGLAAASSGYSSRYAFNSATFDGPLVRLFESPRFADDDRPISMTPEIFGTLTGDGLDRRVEMVALNEPCDSLAARRERGWLIIRQDELYRSRLGYTAGDCLTGVPPAATAGPYSVYSPARRGELPSGSAARRSSRVE